MSRLRHACHDALLVFAILKNSATGTSSLEIILLAVLLGSVVRGDDGQSKKEKKRTKTR